MRSEIQAVYEKCLKEQKASTERLSFMKSVQSGNISIVMKLLQSGANIAEMNDTGQTLLHIATLNKNLEMIQVLLNAGVDVDVRDDNNMTALYYAAVTGNEAIFQTLIRHSTDVSILERNKNGSTLLHDISSTGYEGIVRLIVDRPVKLNADVDTLDNGQRTALYLATTNGHSAVVARLLAAGANRFGKSESSSGETALRAAIKRGHEAVVDVLLAAGCKPTSSDLLVAIRGGYGTIVEKLVAAGADVNARALYRWTALQVAANESHGAIVEKLLVAGCNINARASWLPYKQL